MLHLTHLSRNAAFTQRRAHTRLVKDNAHFNLTIATHALTTRPGRGGVQVDRESMSHA